MFIVYALPRSRTYWVSKFLTYGDWQCSHDEVVHCRSLDDVKSWFSMENAGSVETAASPFWRLARDVPTVVIRRPVDEVIGSMAKLGLQVDRRIIQRLDAKLDQIEQRVPNVLSINFDDLRHEHLCQRLFEFCLPYKHDHDWWQSLSELNLQVDLRHVARYYKAHEAQLTKLSQIAKHTIIADMHTSLSHKEVDDGLTIQEESFDSWFKDSQHLIADHMVLVGEAPNPSAKNIALFRQMDEVGCLQIMTARANGRVFGYLMSVLSPSLESPDIKTAMQTTFYASPDFKGVGMKLQRECLKVLREKGIDEAYFYAGIRGSGARIGSLYKRLGAVAHGEFYKLSLNP